MDQVQVIRKWWFGRSWELVLRWGLTLQAVLSEDDWGRGRLALHIHLGWPGVWIPLPGRWRAPRDCMSDVWGFTLFHRAIHLNWGARTKIVSLPWCWVHVRHTFLSPDGSVRCHEPENRAAGRHSWEPPPEIIEQHPFTYTLRSGEVQRRTATIYGEEREWRWHWLRWLPWPRKIFRSISIGFDDEVGESSGSWKGGVMGCSWEWRHGESMQDALRRMEREREL